VDQARGKGGGLGVLYIPRTNIVYFRTVLLSHANCLGYACYL